MRLLIIKRLLQVIRSIDVRHTLVLHPQEAVAYRRHTGLSSNVQRAVFQHTEVTDICQELLESPANVVMPAPVLKCVRF